MPTLLLNFTWAFGVKSDGDARVVAVILFEVRSGSANEVDRSSVILVISVRKVQSGDVHADAWNKFDYGWFLTALDHGFALPMELYC